jgi:hypothetical protein
MSIAHPQPRGSVVHRVALWLSFAFAVGLGVNVGGALLATTAIFPVWSASPEAAAAWTGAVDETRFFVAVSPLVMILAAATLLASWRAAPEARPWMRVAAVLYILFFVGTLAYFVPGQIAMKGETGALLPPGELGSLLQRWVALNWVRQAVGLVAFTSAIHALGLAYAGAARIRETARTVDDDAVRQPVPV